MESYLPALILAVILLIFYYLINQRLKQLDSSKNNEALFQWLKSMQASVDQTNRAVNEALRDTNKNITSVLQTNTKAMNDRLDNAARVIGEVQKNIGEMSEIGRGMKDLQEFLRSPKLRGNIGEQVLKELLSQMLPKQTFHLQYAFKSGSIVDAAIKTEAGIIPIDSKFPMENFRKMTSSKSDEEKKTFEKDFVNDVKKHIDTISNKYILTNEGTMDYALMYIPSEAVYYEIINNPSLFDYSSQKRVLPVSPMTFYAYLKAIFMGFEGQKISKKAYEILKHIKAVQKEYEKLGENMDTLSKHINNSYNMMNQVQTGFSKLGQQITATNSLEEKEEVKQITVNQEA